MLQDNLEMTGGLYADIDEVAEQIVDYADKCVGGCCTERGRWLQGSSKIAYKREPNGNGKRYKITIELEES